MRGSLKQRYRGSWSIILDLGYEPHPETGKLRRRQKWVTFRGTRAQAEKKLTALLGTLDAGTYVDTTKVTLGEWLREWLEGAVKPRLRASTYTRYKGITERDLGEPVHVVSERLGHAKVSMTLEVYAHVLPDMQQAAAVTLGALLHGVR
jgi:integrase